MREQASFSKAERAPYARPVIEELGSLRELTAAGGPNPGVDSSYVFGGPIPLGLS
jgi:hypothetical protein